MNKTEGEYVSPVDEELVANAGTNKNEIQDIILEETFNELEKKKAAYRQKPNDELVLEIDRLQQKLEETAADMYERKIVSEEKKSDLRHERI